MTERLYQAVTRYICQECGMEVATQKIHNQFHDETDELRAADIAEAEEKAARAQTTMGRFPQTSRLRSDTEWPL